MSTNRFEQAHELHQLARLPGVGPALATQAQQLALARLGRDKRRRLMVMFGVKTDTPLPLISKAAAWQILNYHKSEAGR